MDNVLGIPQSQGALDRLKHMVGLSRSLDWVLTGRTIKAEEAFHCGLVARTVACGSGMYLYCTYSVFFSFLFLLI